MHMQVGSSSIRLLTRQAGYRIYYNYDKVSRNECFASLSICIRLLCFLIAVLILKTTLPKKPIMTLFRKYCYITLHELLLASLDDIEFIGVLDEVWDLIESVSEGLFTYSFV